VLLTGYYLLNGKKATYLSCLICNRTGHECPSSPGTHAPYLLSHVSGQAPPKLGLLGPKVCSGGVLPSLPFHNSNMIPIHICSGPRQGLAIPYILIPRMGHSICGFIKYCTCTVYRLTYEVILVRYAILLYT
jgi:hypothetical protein